MTVADMKLGKQSHGSDALHIGGQTAGMPILVKRGVLGLALVAVLVGCQRTSGYNQGGILPSRQSPVSIQPAPLTPVYQGDLDPASPDGQQAGTPVPSAPGLDQPTQVVSNEPPADAKPVTRQAMVGAWTVSTAGTNCQIFLALTKWSGGYRAASRGCSAASIAEVQAWDVKGSQIVLVNASGSTAATLYRSNNQRFDGSTVSGGAISFTR